MSRQFALCSQHLFIWYCRMGAGDSFSRVALMLPSRRDALNRLRRSLGLPEYTAENLKLRCFSCDLLAKFMATLMAAKACYQTSKNTPALQLVAGYLKEDLEVDWENHRARIFACICWWDQVPSEPNTLRLGVSSASSHEEEAGFLSESSLHEAALFLEN